MKNVKKERVRERKREREMKTLKEKTEMTRRRC